MHQNHDKALRRIFGLDETSERLSATVRELIDTAERRVVRVQGRFREFTYEELVALTINISEKEAVELSKEGQPEQTVQSPTADQFEKMSKGDLLRLCEKRGIRTTGNERHSELSDLLRKKAG